MKGIEPDMPKRLVPLLMLTPSKHPLRTSCSSWLQAGIPPGREVEYAKGDLTMAGFCQVFGKRNPTTSAVRTQFDDSSNGKRLQLRFLFSNEVIEFTGWNQSEFLDVSCDGQTLVIEPSKSGRTLHGKPAFVELTFAKPQLKQVKDFLCFDVQIKHFWERYDVQGKRLLLLLADINLPEK